jgi:hypothetical protein
LFYEKNRGSILDLHNSRLPLGCDWWTPNSLPQFPKAGWNNYSENLRKCTEANRLFGKTDVTPMRQPHGPRFELLD